MIIVYILIAAVVLLGVLVAMQPSDFTVSRTASIAAPPESVFEQVNDLHKWQTWSPWAKMDPTAKLVYEGPVAGAGAAYSWSGNMKVGEGHMAITESRANEVIRFKLDFAKPMKGTNIAEFTFRQSGDQTVVRWSMSGKRNFAAKVFGLFVNCEKMCGGCFEQGLASIKSLVESEARAPQRADSVA